MEKTKVSFQFAGTNAWFTCDEDKLDVTIAKARQANGLVSTHEVEIVRPNNQTETQTQATPKAKKNKSHGTASTTSTDNTANSDFDSNIDLYNALSKDSEDLESEQEAI